MGIGVFYTTAKPGPVECFISDVVTSAKDGARLPFVFYDSGWGICAMTIDEATTNGFRNAYEPLPFTRVGEVDKKSIWLSERLK